MIKQYDIEQNSNHCPQLLEVHEYDADWNITSSRDGIIDLLTYYLHLDTLDNERVYMLALDYFNRAIGIFLIGLGDYKKSEMYNRHIATAIILSGARKIIVAHNHPDGGIALSDDDQKNVLGISLLTQIFGIEFVDSYVITDEGYITNNMTEPVYFVDDEDED